MSEVLVNIVRGEHKEGCHHGDLVVVDYLGKILKKVGNENRFTYWRSCAKPFQLLPLIEQGGIEKFGLLEEEIAAMASSHGGEAKHVQVIGKILDKIGYVEDDLDCGFAPPFYPKAVEETLRKGEDYRKLQNNCSGKHAGMLALAKLLGYGIQNYIELDHPVQQIMLNTIREWVELSKREIKVAKDGCGVPVFGFAIKNMALAYAKLTVPEKVFSGVRAQAARVVLEAMTKYPFHVAGTDRLDTALMEVTRGRLVAKLGAEAVYNIGIKDQGIGICFKIDDGSYRALAPVAVHILKEMDFLTQDEFIQLKNYYRPLLKNHRQEVIGYLEPAFN